MTNLEIENWALRGDLHDYEIALRKAHEIIAEARHILTCHAEEIAHGNVSDFGEAQPVFHPLTQARLDTVKRLSDKCEEFEKLAPKPTDFPDVIGD